MSVPLSHQDPAPPGTVIATPLPEKQRRQMKKLDIPELVGAKQALGSQLVDGRLPKPVLDYVVLDNNVEQRLSIFEKGLVVVHMTGAGGARRACCIHFVGPVEDVWQVFWGDSRAIVADHDRGTFRRTVRLQFNAATIGDVPDRIGDEIVHDLLEAIGIAEELIGFIVHRCGEPYAAGLGFDVMPFDHVAK